MNQLKKTPLNVLLIGNSQMGCWDLPAMISVMAESAPAGRPRINVGHALIGGKGLRGYWDAGTADFTPRAMIASARWDRVVIQEIYSARKREFEDYAARFDDVIRRAGSATIIFATAGITGYYRAGYRYPGSFVKLNDMQIAFGKKRGIPVAAAGYAWMRYLGQNPPKQQLLDLYDRDKGHPGPRGTYIYACLLYAFITGSNPAGLAGKFENIRRSGESSAPGVEIPAEEAGKMQRAAWDEYRGARQ